MNADPTDSTHGKLVPRNNHFLLVRFARLPRAAIAGVPALQQERSCLLPSAEQRPSSRARTQAHPSDRPALAFRSGNGERDRKPQTLRQGIKEPGR